jgi:hypothetical protein
MTEEKHNKYYWDTTRNINDKKVITKGSDYDLDKKLNRKEYPVYTGVIKYFPDALMEVSKVSRIGNEQHHPDKPLHWDKSKSMDHLDALTRHLLNAEQLDNDGVLHLAKVAWRALAALQDKIDKDK